MRFLLFDLVLLASLVAIIWGYRTVRRRNARLAWEKRELEEKLEVWVEADRTEHEHELRR